MNYYEELGLTPTAPPEEIHKAHRTVSRLLHPDQQTDEGLRQAAELQMRRLNAIVDVLLNARTRRQYDESLRTGPHSRVHVSVYPGELQKRPLSSTFDLIGTALAAIIATLATVWVLSSDFGSWRALGAGAPRTASATTESSRPSPIVAAEPAPPPPPVVIRTGPPPGEPHPYQATLIPPHAHAPPADPPPPRPATDELPHPAAAFIPPILAVPLTEITPIGSPAAYAGLWLMPSYGKRGRGSAQAPKYIQIGIHEGERNTIYGDYAARYEVANRPVSPEVAFIFRGSAENNPATFEWMADDGSRGLIELKLLTTDSLQATWHVTEFGPSLAIGNGPAIVLKRAN